MFANELLGHPLVHCTGWALIHFLWQGAVVGLIAALLLAVLRKRSASVRYSVAIAGLAFMAACPLVTIALLPTNSAGASASRTVNEESFSFDTIGLDVIVVSPTEATSDAVTTHTHHAIAQSKPALRFTERLAVATPWIAAVWFIGATLLSLRLLLAWCRVRQMTRVGLGPVDRAVRSLFDGLCARMALRRTVRIFESSMTTVPATVGWLRPIVMLPATAITGLSQEQLVAVLAHELAHVRRHDYAINLIQGAIETLLFYHPAVWLLSARIRTERENCCDDRAVAVTGKPAEYARALAQLAEFCPAPRLVTAASGGELAARVRRLLGLAPTSGRSPRMAGLVALLTLAVICFGVASSMADSSPETHAVSQSSEGPDGKDGGRAIGTHSAEPAQDPAKEEQPLPPLSDTPTWIIAKHVIIFEGQRVVAWEHVEKSLIELGGREGKIKVSFQFTRGANDKFQKVQQDVFKTMRKLPRNIPMSIGSGGLAKHDSVRTQADLDPDPKRRVLGRVLQPDGKSADGAEIVILPPATKNRTQYVYMSGHRVRNKHEHDYRQAKSSGGFVIYPEGSHTLVALHKSGFAIIPVADLRKKPTFRLQQWARVSGRVAETPGYQQSITFSVTRGQTQFTFYDVVMNQEREYELVVPPGKVSASRSVKTGNGSSMGRGVDSWEMKPGEVKQFDLKGMTEFEAEGVELHKRQIEAMRGGKALTEAEGKRLGERLTIELKERAEREAKRKAAEEAKENEPPAGKKMSGQVPPTEIVGRVVWEGNIPTQAQPPAARGVAIQAGPIVVAASVTRNRPGSPGEGRILSETVSVPRQVGWWVGEIDSPG